MRTVGVMVRESVSITSRQVRTLPPKPATFLDNWKIWLNNTTPPECAGRLGYGSQLMVKKIMGRRAQITTALRDRRGKSMKIMFLNLGIVEDASSKNIGNLEKSQNATLYLCIFTFVLKFLWKDSRDGKPTDGWVSIRASDGTTLLEHVQFTPFFAIWSVFPTFVQLLPRTPQMFVHCTP